MSWLIRRGSLKRFREIKMATDRTQLEEKKKFNKSQLREWKLITWICLWRCPGGGSNQITVPVSQLLLRDSQDADENDSAKDDKSCNCTIGPIRMFSTVIVSLHFVKADTERFQYLKVSFG